MMIWAVEMNIVIHKLKLCIQQVLFRKCIKVVCCKETHI